MSNSKTKSVGRYITKSARAGIDFPVERIHRVLKRNSKYKIETEAAVYVTAVLEYLTAEVLDLAGLACQCKHRIRVVPRHISLAVSKDVELRRLVEDLVISDKFMRYYIKSVLLWKPSKKVSSSDKAGSSQV